MERLHWGAVIGEFTKHWWAEHANGILGWRRHLHAHPELSHMEHATTASMEEKLRTAGLEPVPFPNTGLIVDIGEDELADSEVGGERPGHLAFRGDMDALPIAGATGLGFTSTNDGVMHACGRDSHTMIVLATTLAMTEYHEKYTLPTLLRFIF